MSQQTETSPQPSSTPTEGFIQSINKTLEAEAPAVETPDVVEAEAPVDTTLAETTEEPIAKSLQEQLAELDGTDDAPEPVEFSYESEQFKNLEAFVAKELGVPNLREAIEGIKQLQEFASSFKEAQQAQTVEQTATKLRTEWGVNEAEYARRVTEISEYHKKIHAKNPELADQLNNFEGMQIMWGQISRKTPGVASSGSGTASTASKTKAPTFKKADVTNWMLNDPTTYQENAALIAQARAAGTLID